jgi:twitching motility protein PilT
MIDYAKKLGKLLEITIKEQASDLHFSVGHPPVIRVSGNLIPLLKEPVLAEEDTKGLVQALMNKDDFARFLEKK